MKTKSFRFGTAVILGTLVLAVAGAVVPAQAQTYTVLDNFLVGGPGPQWPGSYLTQGRDGDLYGHSYYGGATNNGSIWKTDPSGTVSVIYSFASGNDCQNGMTLGTDGNFYGTDYTNCTGAGYAFKLTPSGTRTVLHTFTGTPDGYGPGPLTQYTDGNFYGITTTGGANNFGSVFKITPTGTLTILYSFTNNPDGYRTPTYGLTVGNDGNFYGTFYSGANIGGGVFKMTPSGTVTLLHAFTSAPDGVEPASGVILGNDGNFYGNTQFGGTQNEGTIFKMTPSGTVTILHSFYQPSDYAINPTAPLVQATDGNFYCADPGCSQFGCGQGDIFEVTPSGTLTVLQELPGGPNGYLPYWPVIQHTNGIMYGVAQQGGTVNGGVLFSLNISAAPFVSLVTTSGRVGDQIGILGQGFTGASVVRFGGTQATTITLSGTTFITATVPVGAVTGNVTVTTGSTTLTSNTIFRVTLQITSAVSRKTHGAAGVFDISLPLSGTPGLESRTGDYTLVATFTNNVVSGNASVTSGVGTVNGSPTFSGQTMTINLTGVTTAQTLTVTLTGVTDEFSQVLPDTPVSMRVLIGDTNANGTVNSGDVALCKSHLGEGVVAGNFRADVNANGVINATDAAIVKSHLGEGVP